MLTYEPWKYTKPKKFIEASQFDEASVDTSALQDCPQTLQRFLEDEQVSRVVFLNGQFVPQWSDENLLGNGGDVVATSNLPKEVLSLFDSTPEKRVDIHLPKNTKKKIALLNLYNSQTSFRCQRQTLVYVGAGSNLDLTEVHLGVEETGFFVQNKITTKLDPSAKLRHVRYFAVGDQAKVLDEHSLSVGASAEARLCHLNFGGDYVRNQLDAYLSGEQAYVGAFGLTLGSGKNHVDNQTSIHHQFPHTQSEQLYKGVYADRSRGIFSGRIVIDKNAQKSNSSQFSRNLTLSDRAEIDTKPQLEVQADDVKAAHGATVGQLSDTEMFYLQTRGITKKAAQKMLAEAFALEVLEKSQLDFNNGVVAESLRAKMENML